MSTQQDYEALEQRSVWKRATAILCMVVGVILVGFLIFWFYIHINRNSTS